MPYSKLTSKNQATIPKEIRKKLRLKSGDCITFEISIDDAVIIRKAQPFDLEFAQAVESTLSEWESDYDEKDYEDL